MDNEKEIFLRSFKELENEFQALPIAKSHIERLESHLSEIQKIAEDLALYDPLTHALNKRAGEWLVPNENITGMAKIDIYDLRQANKVYGVAVADSELHKLAYHLMSMFTVDMGDFVCRSPGSDEFRIFSTSKTPQEMRLLLTKPYLDQELDSLLTWDFGTGRTETESENNLQKQRMTMASTAKALHNMVWAILKMSVAIPARPGSGIKKHWIPGRTPFVRILFGTLVMH